MVSGVVECWQLTSDVEFSSWTQLAIHAHFIASGQRGSGYDVATALVELYSSRCYRREPTPGHEAFLAGRIVLDDEFLAEVSTRALLAKAKPSGRAPLNSMRQGVDRLVSAWEEEMLPPFSVISRNWTLYLRSGANKRAWT